MLITNLIIVYAAVTILILPFLIIKGKRYRLSYQLNHTIYYVKNVLGWIIGINGPIRVGKTSLLSGLSSVSQIIIINEINDLLTNTMKKFKTVDFNNLNILVVDLYEKFKLENGYPDFEKITTIILEKYNLKGESLHYNMIGHVEIHKLILDYIFSFYCLNIRNNYVQSKTPFYSNITHEFSYYLNSEWLKIRDAFKNKEYAILDWMVILIDELTDEAGAMSYLDDIKDLAGAKEYRRKMGQIHQERNRIISTKQDVMDEVKKYRNLTHSNLVLDEKVKTVGNHKWIYSIIKFIYYIPIKLLTILVIRPIFIYSFIFRKNQTYDDIYTHYHNKVGLIRRQESKLYYFQMFFESIGYNKYVGFDIKRAEDIEKSTADRDYFKLYIPTVYCWGTYDTHYYSPMQKELLSISQVTSTEVNPFIKKSFFDESIYNQEKEQNGVGEFEFD